MSLEVEKKYRLGPSDRERIASALSEAGAEFIGHEFEENTIFSSHEMLKRSSIVRIRKIGGRCLLTFKRRIESKSDVKEQVEHETAVADPDVMTSILHELGLSPRVVYEKKRDTWKFRSVEVVLDELPFGDFMEIEGSRTSIREAELLLGLDNIEAEIETYPLLTARLGTNVNDVIEARFKPDAR